MSKDQTIENIASEATKRIFKEQTSDLQVNLNYLISKTENAKKENLEVEKRLAENKSLLKNVEDNVNKEKKEILDQIAELNKKAKEKDAKAQAAMESAIQEKNFLEQEKSNVIGKREELQGLIDTYTAKHALISRLLEDLK